jgi:hypothetical protein
MTTTNGNRRILDVPRWEIISNTIPSSATSSFMLAERNNRQLIFYNSSVTFYAIDPHTGGWVNIPASGIGGWSGGSAACVKNLGPSGTCSSNGTSTTLVTADNLQRGLNGYKVHITGGPGAGDVREIQSNTTGANATITVTSAFSASPTTSTTYRLLTPRVFAMQNNSTSASAWRRYCYALNTWADVAAVGPPALFGTDARLCPINSFEYGDFVSFATGTATSGGASTISNSAKSWATNQWANHQIRITGGTGAGQIRTISSNTGTQITVGSAWTTTPDSTSAYSIEANDDHIYLTGNGSTTFYRWSISGASWTTMGARGGAPGSGATLHHANDISHSSWTNESDYLNGRYLYSYRANTTAILERYDISANSWSSVSYAYNNDNIPSGATSAYDSGKIYSFGTSLSSPSFVYDIVSNTREPYIGPFLTASGSSGERSTVVKYIDGATKIPFIYLIPSLSQVLMRNMVIE